MSLSLSFCWSGHVSSSLWSNVSKVTSLKDRSLKVLSKCICLCHCLCHCLCFCHYHSHRLVMMVDPLIFFIGWVALSELGICAVSIQHRKIPNANASEWKNPKNLFLDNKLSKPHDGGFFSIKVFAFQYQKIWPSFLYKNMSIDSTHFFCSSVLRECRT